MKPTKKWIQSLIQITVPVMVGITFADATPKENEEAPCGIILKVGQGTQIIPKHGNVESKFQEQGPVVCSSMVITHEDPFWIKLADQTVIKVAPHSFIEIPKLDSKIFHIYRGQVMVSAPPGITAQSWSSPNSEVIFSGGVAYVQYQPDNRVTVTSCFNREFQFRNKFNNAAVITVRAGEMSHLAIQEASVNPSQPAVMNQSSVTQALAGLKLSESDQTELSAVVKRVYDDRAKSLTSELQDWESAPTEAEKTPSRSIASVKGVAPAEKAIDPKEAEFVSRKMMEHLYGDASDAKIMSQSRKPASTGTKANLIDSEKQKQKNNLKQETKRLEKEIGRVNTNDE